MHLPNKPVDKLEIADIQRLIEIGISEDKFIEYKEELHLEKDKGNGRNEFLHDITSFANTLGGEIIYGIEEERDKRKHPTGLPKEIKGTKVENLDKLGLLIESLFRDCVDERLAGYSYHFIPVKEDKYVLIFRIRMSLKAPHMIKATNRFYARGGSGKYIMDVREIKMAFDRTTGLKERAEKFIAYRLKQVSREVIPNSPTKGGYIVGHFVPLLREEYQLDITNQAVIERLREVNPPIFGGYSSKFIYEGFKTFSGDINWDGNYTLFFRDGSVEFYAEDILHHNEIGEWLLASVWYEKELIKYFDQIRELYEDNTINLPFIYSMSLVNIQGVKMPYGGSRGPTRYTGEINKDSLLLRRQVDDLSQDSATILKPLFDMIWNAFGEQRSLNYTEDGVFSPPE